MTLGQQLLIAYAAAALLMLVLWLIQRQTRNAGIVDVGWTLGIGAAVLGLSIGAVGDSNRRVLIAAMTGVWALRLGWHLIRRISREPEDGRYQALREWAGPRAQVALFWFFQLQAAWIVLFALPQTIAMQNARGFGWPELAGLGLFLLSVFGEGVADQQLDHFRRRQENRGRVCNVGLWRYSRHPNYFFEWLHWFAYPLMALGMGALGWVTLFGPAAMLYLLLFVTGIPPTEARALRSRGDAYRAYQRTTSAFFPWFPAKERA